MEVRCVCDIGGKTGRCSLPATQEDHLCDICRQPVHAHVCGADSRSPTPVVPMPSPFRCEWADGINEPHLRTKKTFYKDGQLFGYG
jgi:hypothetical protein